MPDLADRLVLVLMRHATAEPTAGTDAVRRLTDRGRLEARAAGAWLAARPETPDLVLASTAARAEETAEVVASLCGVRRLELLEPLYGADPYDVLEQVAETALDDQRVVLVVGHNPTMEQLASMLVEDEALHFAASAGAVVELDAESWDAVDAGHGRLVARYPTT